MSRPFSEGDKRRLAEKLERYALTLPDSEKRLLFEILLQTMEPLDRFRYIRTSDLLSAEEEALLRSLEKDHEERKSRDG